MCTRVIYQVDDLIGWAYKKYDIGRMCKRKKNAYNNSVPNPAREK
jgi:hypothetical protein